MKFCGRCRETKPFDRFHKWKRGDGRQVWCKDCRKVYDAAYHQRVRERRLEQKRIYQREFDKWFRSLKSNTPCADCGQTYHPAVMQWDHLPGFEKTGNVSDFARKHSRKRVLAEIEKCELVCANCHAARTHGSYT